MKNFILFLLITASCMVHSAQAQNMAINIDGSTPDASAMVDIASTTKGFLMPRMTTTQQNTIPSPATGLLIFNTTDNVFKVNTGTSATPVWTPLLYSGNAINSINGLTGTTQTFSTGTTGTDFNISSSGGIHTFNIPTASAARRGALSAADWTTFNGKQTALGFTPYNATNPSGYISSSTLAGATDAAISSPANGQVLQYNFATGKWVNTTPGFLTSYTETDPVVKAINGLVKSNGTTISAAVAGTDYVVPSGSITGSSVSFTGNLAGDVTGTQIATVVGNAAVIGKLLTGYTSGAGTVAASDNILQAIQKINGNDVLKAPLASPSLTGIPAAPTAAAGNNTTQIATTAFVTAAVNSGSAMAWAIAGNAVTAGSQFLGSTNNVSLRMRTNNAERMVVDSVGNVGIGITNPAFKLAVKDSMEIRRTSAMSQLLFTNTSGSGDFRIGGDGADIYWQGGGGRSLQMGSYWATVLGGDRQSNTFPSFVNGIGGTSVIVAAQRDASVPLGIQANSTSQTANLTEWRKSNGTVLDFIDKSGNVSIGGTALNITNPEQLLVDAATTTSVNAIVGKGSLNNYLQLNIQNTSSGNSASSDVVATANNGDETSNYVDMGINGSGNTNNIMGGANDGYLYTMGNNFLLGTGNALKSLVFMTGGTIQSTNERMRIDGNGKVGIGLTAPTAMLHLKSGTATANTAPLKLTSGINLTTPEDGAVEYDGTHFYASIGSSRYQLDQQTPSSFSGNLAGDVTGTQSATVVGKINGTSLAGLSTGILKNTTTTGVPSIAVAADFPTLNQNTTGTAAGLSANIAESQVTNLTGDLAAKAPIASPTLTGVPAAPTATPGTNTTQIATTAFVTAAVSGGTATSFSGNLAGDVTGTQSATVVGNAAVIGKLLTGYTSGAGTVAATDNILQAIQKINGNDALTAPIASPTLTGTPAAPTATAGNNTTQIATTAFVTAAVNSGTAASWGLTGNSVVPGSQFLGAANNVSLRMRTNNIERMVVDSFGNVGIGTTTFNTTNAEKLLVDAGTTTSVNAIVGKGSVNNYLQLNIQNNSAGANASSDVVATANNGSETTNFVDMGINGGSNTSNVMGGANDGYLYTMGNNFLLGTGNASKSLVFMTGGTTQSTNERMRIDGSGNVGIGTNAPRAYLDVNNNSSSTIPALKLGKPFAGSNNDSLLTWNPADSSVRRITTSSVLDGFTLPLMLANGAVSSTTSLRDYDAWVSQRTYGGNFVTDAGASITSPIPNETAWFALSNVATYPNSAGLNTNYFGQTSLNDHNLYFRGGTVNTSNGAVSSVGWQKNLSIPASSQTTISIDAGNNATFNVVDNAAYKVNTNNIERMQIDKLGNVAIGTSTFNAANPEQLVVDASTTSSVNAIVGKGTINNYLQLNIQNNSSGTNASSDVVATANNGSETSNFVDMGINGSGNTSGLMGGANDGYLYTQGNNFLIGTGNASKSLIFMTGGTIQSTNERVRIDGSGNVGIGTNNPNSTLSVNGSQSVNLRSGTGAYSISNSDYVIINTGGGTPTWTLPAASSYAGRVYRLINQGTSNVTLSQAVTTASGTTSTTLSNTAGSNTYEIIADGSVWRKMN